MFVYRVDYLVPKDSANKLPKYVVADSFDAALKAARKFETDKVVLYECAVQLSDGYVTIARGFKGLSASNEEAAPAAKE
jgi:hypothetical protein